MRIRLPLLLALTGCAPEVPQTQEDVDPQVTVPVVDACNPVSQVGCATAELCAPIVTTATAGAGCIPDDGRDAANGEPCSGGLCAPGSICVRLEPSAATCERLCDASDGSGCEGHAPQICWQRLAGTNWAICRVPPPACALLSQAPCGAGESCQLVDDPTGATASRCLPAGPGVAGAPCSSGSSGSSDCARGLLCVRFDAAARCHAICRDTGDCTGGTTCSGALPDQVARVCR